MERGNIEIGCHFEGAYLANVNIASTKNIFGDTCRYYSAWNGVNIYLGGENATFNIIKGQLDSPGEGRPNSAGIVLGGAASDWVANNVIDVVSLDQKDGAIAFAHSDGDNAIRVRGFQTSGTALSGTPNTTDEVDILIVGATVEKINTINQSADIAIIASGSTVWTYPFAFAAIPDVKFTPRSPSGNITSGIWISDISETSVTIYNNNAVTMNLQISATR